MRLKEYVAVPGEVRRKSKFVVAWGTCACFGGIPAKANAYDLEELIAETYGRTTDAFAYYLSGKSGIEHDKTYQKHGMELLRQAGRLDAYEKIDYMVPGCAPTADHLLELVEELIGGQVSKAKAIVCAECPRKVARDIVSSFRLHSGAADDPTKCLTAMGVACMGFVTRGGCAAACPSSGQPCWSCRGPSAVTFKKILEGHPYEEVFAKALSQRCHSDETKTREHVRLLRRQGHALYNFDGEIWANVARYR